jgi:hypothetical protein
MPAVDARTRQTVFAQVRAQIPVITRTRHKHAAVFSGFGVRVPDGAQNLGREGRVAWPSHRPTGARLACSARPSSAPAAPASASTRSAPPRGLGWPDRAYRTARLITLEMAATTLRRCGAQVRLAAPITLSRAARWPRPAGPLQAPGERGSSADDDRSPQFSANAGPPRPWRRLRQPQLSGVGAPAHRGQFAVPTSQAPVLQSQVNSEIRRRWRSHAESPHVQVPGTLYRWLGVRRGRRLIPSGRGARPSAACTFPRRL